MLARMHTRTRTRSTYLLVVGCGGLEQKQIVIVRQAAGSSAHTKEVTHWQRHGASDAWLERAAAHRVQLHLMRKVHDE